jgi:glycosyltransferase involved in cell wall biosynthesis
VKPFLTVVIPCYNEEKNLRRGVLNEVEKYLKKQGYPSKVIISDDGSTDKSREIIQKFIKYQPRFKLLKNKHAGKPYAVKAGVMKAKGEIVLFTDMDQSTPLSEVENLLPYFEKNFDVVIGSRGTVRRKAPWYRKIMAKGFLFVRRLILLQNIVDTQCGFKAFKNKVARDLFRSLKIYGPTKKEVKGGRVTAFDVELLFLAEKKGYEIAEVPVEWSYEAAKRVNYLKESFLMTKEILRVKINDWRGEYGK